MRMSEWKRELGGEQILSKISDLAFSSFEIVLFLNCQKVQTTSSYNPRTFILMFFLCFFSFRQVNLHFNKYSAWAKTF